MRWWKLILSVIISFFLLVMLIPFPSPLFSTPYATVLESNEGVLLSAVIASDEQWRFPPSDTVPEKFKVALLAFEDEHFYEHLGINPMSILRAARQNHQAGKIVSGGSTISMQTMRMAFNNQSRTYLQKIKEAIATLKLELLYSKEEILNQYVSHAPFGRNIVGLNAASWKYFNRPAELLSWAEACMLAILPNNPAQLYPGKNNSLLLEKRNQLLDKLFDAGHMTSEENFLAKEEPLPNGVYKLPDLAPHLLYTAIKEGNQETIISSTLDLRLQTLAKQKLNTHSRKWTENEVHNAAALVIEIKTGKTLAYVGNSSNPGDHGQYVDIIRAQRSPGSLLKPILYALSLDEAILLPKQLLPDIPVFYEGFTPQNFDKDFRGAIPADKALISSLNVPFVHLLKKYGYEKFHFKMRQMGMKSLTQPPQHYGLSLILGSAETSLWELSSVYASMVRAHENLSDRPIGRGYSKLDYHENHYLSNPLTSSDSVFDKSGIISTASIGHMLTAMQQLTRPDSEAGWKRFNNASEVAWKTGTSYGLRDAWAIGIKGEYLVAVWLGNADGEGRFGLTGVQAAAPLLFQITGLLPQSNLNIYHSGSPTNICLNSGMISSPHCTETQSMFLNTQLQLTQSCTYHQALLLDKNMQYQVNSACYDLSQAMETSWFTLPPAMSYYYKKHNANYQVAPPFREDCLPSGSRRWFELIYPKKNTKVLIPRVQDGEKGMIVFEAAHDVDTATLFWHLDNEFLGATKGVHQIGLTPTAGNHRLTLVDQFGSELSRSFEVIQ